MSRAKVVVYGYDNGKIWFGRPTFISWVHHFFNPYRLLTIKPIKGYEEYNYYPDRLYTSTEWANLTKAESNPIGAIIEAERIRGRDNIEFINRNEL